MPCRQATHDVKALLTDFVSIGSCLQVGQIVEVQTAADIHSAGSLKNAAGHIIMEAPDWRIIPAENLVAEFQVIT